MSGLRTALASKLFRWLAALEYRALITAGFLCRKWRYGYRWIYGAMICGGICLRGGTFVASCWRFRCFILGGVGVYGGIIRTLLSDWFGGGGVMISCSGVAALMGGALGTTVMGGVVTFGKN